MSFWGKWGLRSLEKRKGAIAVSVFPEPVGARRMMFSLFNIWVIVSI
jgi:hypothetical protein